jgi:arsenate reductase
MKICPLQKEHYPEVSKIYADGLATGVASFETAVPSWEEWNAKFLKACRFVVLLENKVIAWCALSAISNREVYKGVAEDTVYVASNMKGKGIGKILLQHLVVDSEKLGFWTLQAGIFPQNKSSIAIHEQCGFRILGKREKIAQRDGKWYDNVIMERRSKHLNNMKNILVLCTGNSCRSQMAHGYLETFSKGKANIYSAGIETHGLNPKAVKTMAEDAIDIAHYTSNHVNEYDAIDFDFIITVCDHANENCPYIPSKKAVRLHHNFLDPSKVSGSPAQIKSAFVNTRDEIKAYCESFVSEYL